MRYFIYGLLIVILATAGLAVYLGQDLWRRGYFREPVIDRTPPDLGLPEKPATDAGLVRILIFSKANRYRHESIDAAKALFMELGDEAGWTIHLSDNGAVHNHEQLEHFDMVIWNNVTGDVLNTGQRFALRNWVENGGRFVGLHGTGGDLKYAWKWRVRALVGAQFKGHTLLPQTRAGVVYKENPLHPIVQGIPDEWTWTEEWYSFHDNPRDRGAQIVMLVREASYDPFPYLRMPVEHPVLWYQVIGKGVTVYSALGHLKSAWTDSNHRRLMRNTIEWLMSPQSRPQGLVEEPLVP